MNSISMKTVIKIFRNRPFLLKLSIWIYPRNNFCRKMTIFDQNWPLWQVNWVNFKRSVIIFFKNIPFLIKILYFISFKKKHFLSKNDDFWSKLTPFTSKLSQLKEKCYEFFRNGTFFDQNSFDSSWLVQESVLCRIK